VARHRRGAAGRREGAGVMRSILLVCTANICRSPMAEGVLRKKFSERGLDKTIEIDSVATHDYHVGKPPFPPAIDAAKRRGYDISRLQSRRIGPRDFDHYDLILAMDKSNVATLKAIAPTRCKQKIELLAEYGDKYYGKEIPDPYGGKPQDFEIALDMIEDACEGLVTLLARSQKAG
jgi:protein-tyrosine phosphatase